jgi:hypothetical protein
MPCGGHIGGWSEQNEDLHGHQLSGNHILYLVYIHTCIFGENSVIFLPICNYYTPFYLYLIKSETTYIMYHDIHIQIGCWIRMKYGFFFFFFWGSLINHSKSNYFTIIDNVRMKLWCLTVFLAWWTEVIQELNWNYVISSQKCVYIWGQSFLPL